MLAGSIFAKQVKHESGGHPFHCLVHAPPASWVMLEHIVEKRVAIFVKLNAVDLVRLIGPEVRRCDLFAFDHSQTEFDAMAHPWILRNDDERFAV